VARSLTIQAVRATCLLAVLAAFATSCADNNPTGTIGLGPADAAKKLSLVTWYSCSRMESETEWTCDYSSPIGTSLVWSPDPWQFSTSSYMMTTLSDCSIDSTTCNRDGRGTSEPVPTNPQDDYPINKPTCTPASIAMSQEYKDWCSGRPPTGHRLDVISTAVEQIRAKGGVCAQLAAIADALLGRGDLHVYTGDAASVGGFAPRGGGSSGTNSYMGLHVQWTDIFPDAAHKTKNEPHQRDLQFSLAHELDHLYGSSHVVKADGKVDPYVTTNNYLCGVN
jgi:hypothetical protein